MSGPASYKTLQTSHLWLRPLQLDDAPAIQQIFPNWEVVRYLAASVPWPYPPDGALTYLRDCALPAVARGEEWHWTLRLKCDPDTVIGLIALTRSEDHNRGFWLGVPWQGQGLMTEAANAVTDFWFDVLGFPVLRVPKANANAGSRKISENSGMRVIATEERDYVAGRMLSQTWEITAEEWHRFRGHP